jgi:hypothetical protein
MKTFIQNKDKKIRFILGRKLSEDQLINAIGQLAESTGLEFKRMKKNQERRDR